MIEEKSKPTYDNPKGTLASFYQIKVIDEEGNETYDSGKHRCESFVIGFLQHLRLMFRADELTNITDITGTVRALRQSQPVTTVTTPGGATGHAILNSMLIGFPGFPPVGIIIGTGTTAVTATDHRMVTPIAEGTGTGQMLYAAMVYRDPVPFAGPPASIIFRLVRTANNESGAAIVVNEIGVVVETRGVQAGPGTGNFFLIARDVITAVSVPHRQAIQVIYTLETIM